MSAKVAINTQNENDVDVINTSSMPNKWLAVGRATLDMLQQAISSSRGNTNFLLPELLLFLNNVNSNGSIFPYFYKVWDFEVWLKRFSGLSAKEILDIKQNIVGMRLSPLNEIQAIPTSDFSEQTRPVIVAGHPYADADAATVSLLTWMNLFYSNKHSATLLAFPLGIPNYGTKQVLEELLGENFTSILTTKMPKPFIPLVTLPWELISENDVVNEEFLLSIDDDWSKAKAMFNDTDTIYIGLKQMDGGIEPIGLLKKADVNMSTACDLFLCDHSDLNDFSAKVSYINLIGIIDHHKLMINSSFPCFVQAEQTQSCATLVAEKLLNISRANTKNTWIDGKRTQFHTKLLLYAILDDTDNLSRVHFKDVFVTAQLLDILDNNSQLTSAMPDDNISNIKHQLLTAIESSSSYANLISWNDRIKNQAVDRMIEDFVKDPIANQSLIADLKAVQQGKIVINQIKLSPENIGMFLPNKEHIIKGWIMNSNQYATSNASECHLLMINTIGQSENKNGMDDLLFIWQPHNCTKPAGAEFLFNFIKFAQYNSFVNKVYINIDNPTKANAAGHGHLLQTLKANFAVEEVSWGEDGPNIGLDLVPGKLNSRKYAVAPFLPDLSLITTLVAE